MAVDPSMHAYTYYAAFGIEARPTMTWPSAASASREDRCNSSFGTDLPIAAPAVEAHEKPVFGSKSVACWYHNPSCRAVQCSIRASISADEVKVHSF